MASFRDMFDDVKSKFSGKQDTTDYDETDEFVDDVDDVPEDVDRASESRVSFNDYYDRNEVVERPTRSVSTHRSSGLDSLFSSTEPDAQTDISADKTELISPVSAGSNRPARHTNFDNSAQNIVPGNEDSEPVKEFDAFEGKKRRGSVSLSRQVCVIKPESYEEASEIAKALKQGAVVILAMEKCSTALSKRFLDFGFGVASAMDGSVEAIADNTFALTIGEGVSANEIQRARREGLL